MLRTGTIGDRWVGPAPAAPYLMSVMSTVHQSHTMPRVGATTTSAGMSPVEAVDGPGVASRGDVAVTGAALRAVAVGTGTAVLYSAASLYRFWMMKAGVDLAIFGEAVRHYANGDLPWSQMKAVQGFNLLGDHFSPVIALAAPIYRLWPHVWVLLIVQAVLIGLAAGILTYAAVRRVGRGLGLVVGAVYALSWGTQGLALFDFHEVAFALPLLVVVYLRLLDGRYRSAALWAMPLMAVKEDSVFLLLGVVLVLLAKRQWGTAALLGTYAIASFAFIVGFLIPGMSWSGRYTYWSSSAAGEGSPFVAAARNVVQAGSSGLAPLLLAILIVPVAALALRSPLMLGVLPPLAARFTSPQHAYWGPDFHYNATITVIVAVALLDGLIRLNGRPRWARAGAAWALAGTLVLLPWAPLGQLVRSPLCGDCHAVVMKVLNGHIPDGARVAAGDTAAAYLVDRVNVHGLHEEFLDSTGRPILPDYIVVDRIRDDGWQGDWLNNTLTDLTDYTYLGEAVRTGQPGLLDYDYAVVVPRQGPVPVDGDPQGTDAG